MTAGSSPAAAGGRADLTRLSAAHLSTLLTTGQVSSVEVTRAHLDRIAAVDGAVHAFLHVDDEGAIATATATDRRRLLYSSKSL